MTDEQAREALVATIVEWLQGHTRVDEFIEAYWAMRKRILDENPSVFTDAFGDVMSHVDVATDNYATSPDDPLAIDEASLRDELQEYLEELRANDLTRL